MPKVANIFLGKLSSGNVIVERHKLGGFISQLKPQLKELIRPCLYKDPQKRVTSRDMLEATNQLSQQLQMEKEMMSNLSMLPDVVS